MESIKISKAELGRLLYDGGVFAGKSKIMPILSCVSVATKGGRIRFESTDGDNFIRAYGTCESSADVSFCVNAKEFSSFISSLDDEEIVLKYDTEKGHVLIKHACGRFKIPVFSTEEFPVMRTLDGAGGSMELSGEMFASWLTTACDFTAPSTGSAVSVLEGVYVYADEQYVGVCGGCHQKIFTARVPNKENMPSFGIVVPQSSALIIARLCASSDNIKLSYSDNAIVVNAGNVMMYSLLINLEYPKVSRFFDAKGSHHTVVDGAMLQKSLKRIVSQQVDGNNILHLSCTGSELELLYDAVAESNKKMSEVVPCDGDAFGDVLVNIKTYYSVLSHCGNGKVLFYHEDSARSPFFFENAYADAVELSMLATLLA